MAPNNEKQFSFEVVASLLAALNDQKVTLGSKHYEIMAKIDASKTKSGYEHYFRDVKSRAKEISDMMKEQKLDGVVEKPKGSGGGSRKKSGNADEKPKGRKRGKSFFTKCEETRTNNSRSA